MPWPGPHLTRMLTDHFHTRSKARASVTHHIAKHMLRAPCTRGGTWGGADCEHDMYKSLHLKNSDLAWKRTTKSVTELHSDSGDRPEAWTQEELMGEEVVIFHGMIKKSQPRW